MQIGFFCLLILLITKPLGIYITNIYAGKRTLLTPVLGPVERRIYRITGIDDSQEMRWTTYTVALLLFSLVSMLITYTLLRVQGG
ncbi:MAG TPA: potassium-transporting ATPase subunit KdpA, partial [Thermomicrobiales bacterium]|nr:potassium-transporting ATPase subunit KdpA [Thermomicrobiales bacterium]